MLALDDVTDILNIDVLGIVPDDEIIVISTNRGEAAVETTSTPSGAAYLNIIKRLMGEDVPLISLEESKSFMTKIKRIFGKKR